MDFANIAYHYAKSVVVGKISACRFVHLACQRHLSDLEKYHGPGADYRFNPVLKRKNGKKFRPGDNICHFMQAMQHVKGPLAGARIALEPWQVFILMSIFGWVKQDGKRRFRRSYIEVPRGNAKSTLSSAVALYMMALDDEGGAECYSLATTRDQAKIVFGDGQAMARKSTALRERFGVEVSAHAVFQVSSRSRFCALSSQGNSLDGLNIHFGCIDELHAHRTRTVYDVVETGTGKRDNSLLWVITTAGSDRSGICYEVRNYISKVLDGHVDDEGQFGIIYGLDDGDDWTTEEALVKANPNWNISVRPEVIKGLQQKAMATPSAVNNFLTKHLNEWVSADTSWMDMRAWERCGSPDLRLDDFKGRRCWIGLDLASKTDIAALVMLFDREDSGRYAVFSQFYLPEDAVTSSGNSQYSGWARGGRMLLTPGNVLDFEWIKAALLDIRDGFDVQVVAYDPWQATQFSSEMMAEGLNMVEVGATVRNFSEPMKRLEELVLRGELTHDGDPVMAWMMSNVVCHMDVKENIYPRKERPENKIDGVVALIMAISRAILPQDTGYPVIDSTYEMVTC
ncbi:MAG: terminase large subunit [Magnetococcales bacterium]|nr:terminase large subunit [Magnetococcales bacterium]